MQLSIVLYLLNFLKQNNNISLCYIIYHPQKNNVFAIKDIRPLLPDAPTKT